MIWAKHAKPALHVGVALLSCLLLGCATSGHLLSPRALDSVHGTDKSAVVFASRIDQRGIEAVLYLRRIEDGKKYYLRFSDPDAPFLDLGVVSFYNPKKDTNISAFQYSLPAGEYVPIKLKLKKSQSVLNSPGGNQGTPSSSWKLKPNHFKLEKGTASFIGGFDIKVSKNKVLWIIHSVTIDKFDVVEPIRKTYGTELQIAPADLEVAE